MSQSRKCAKCSTELPAGAPEGLCPKCLMAAGLESRPGNASAAPTTPHPGSFVPPLPKDIAGAFPQLEILELLGHGGMGAVYKAKQIHLDRLVALKIIRPESASAPGFAERFSREAKTLGRLNHPHIVAIHDFGKANLQSAAGSSRPLYYFVMEYVDGTNLRALIQEGALKPQEALAIVPQVCEALQYAHDEGVVHRDIKPENILIDKRGRVKIADFGLAKLMAQSPEEFTLTGTHQVMGTPRYMAPEQMEGSHAVDHRADIYSLGVVFYELLTGEVPAGHFDPPSKKVEVDVRLDDVVLRSLAREPERRYQKASEVKTAVETVSSFSSQTRTLLSQAVDFSHTSWSRWLPLATSLMAFLLGGAGAMTAYSWVSWGQVYNTASKTWHHAAGIGWWQGMLTCGAFVGVLLVLVASLPWRRIPLWRPLLLIFASLLAIYGAANYRIQLTNGTLRLQPFLEAASWGISIDGKRPETINEGMVVAQVESGPSIAIGLAVAILAIGAIEIAARAGGVTSHAGKLAKEIPAKPRGTLWRAWDQWWAERDRWVTLSVQILMILIFFACLMAFANMMWSNSIVTASPEHGGGELRHIVVEYGIPGSRWTRFELNPDAKLGMVWKINWISWSTAILLLGNLVWWINWQIEKAKAANSEKLLRWWDGSPGFGIAIWGVVILIALIWGTIQMNQI